MSVDGPSGDRTQYRLRSLLLRTLSGVAVGSIPGALIAYFGSQRIGLAVVFLGVPIGVLVAFGCATPQRSLRLLLAVLAEYNIPFMHGNAFEWVDERGGPTGESVTASNRLLQWLAASGAGERRSLSVLGALVVGMIVGGVLAARDVEAVQGERPGLLLPLTGAKDSIVTQAVLVTLAVGIWVAAAVGILISAAYRRLILLVAAVTGYFSGCIGFAIDDGRGVGVGIVGLMVCFTTATTGIALLLIMLGITEHEPVDAATADPGEDDKDQI